MIGRDRSWHRGCNDTCLLPTHLSGDNRASSDSSSAANARTIVIVAVRPVRHPRPIRNDVETIAWSLWTLAPAFPKGRREKG